MDCIAISAGRLTSYCLHADGTLSAWGENGTGEIGDGTRTDRHAPSPVCPVGAGNCDGSAANGCEVDLRSDAKHCGHCGAVRQRRLRIVRIRRLRRCAAAWCYPGP